MTEQEKQKALNGLECCSAVPSRCSSCPYEPKELEEIRENNKLYGHACTMHDIIHDLGKLILRTE